MVDLTWSSAGLISGIRGWRVLEDLESYSDHHYISFELRGDHCDLDASQGKNCLLFPKWSFRKMDLEKFSAAAELLCQTFDVSQTPPEECAVRLRGLVTEVCDFSAPRQRGINCTQAYWWTERIAGLRSSCCKKRRILTKVRTRIRQLHSNLSEEERQQLLAVVFARKELRVAKNRLVTEIRRSKTSAWRQLIDALDKDPWGRPYKMVLDKLRKASPSVIETLEPDRVACILNDLFPDNAGTDVRPVLSDASDWESNFRIDDAELKNAIKRKRSRNVASGPDGLQKCIWSRAPDTLQHQILEIFNKCLAEGSFPGPWKTAKLVLIPKPNKPKDSIRYRPICLLDEIEKIFERIIAARLNRHMVTNSHAQLSEFQFGFRAGRSTTETLLAVRGFTDLAFAKDQCVIAVALDIKNAFNSLPWGSIILELERKDFPGYLIKIMSSYLSDRGLLYVGCDKNVLFKNMTTGVPQRSILGPIL